MYIVKCRIINACWVFGQEIGFFAGWHCMMPHLQLVLTLAVAYFGTEADALAAP